MTRRFILAFGTLVLVGAWVQAHMNPGLSINREAAGGIEVGMCEADVAALLGLPAGDYSTGVVGLDEERHDWLKEVRLSTVRHFHSVQPVSEGGKMNEWLSDRAYVAVWFDKDEKVEKFCIEDLVRARLCHESPWAKLRRWLRL